MKNLVMILATLFFFVGPNLSAFGQVRGKGGDKPILVPKIQATLSQVSVEDLKIYPSTQKKEVSKQRVRQGFKFLNRKRNKLLRRGEEKK